MQAAGYVTQLETQNQMLSHSLMALVEHTRKLAQRLQQERDTNQKTKQVILDLGKEVSSKRLQLFGQ